MTPAAARADFTVQTQNGLRTAIFSDRTDDAALAAEVPALAAASVQSIVLRGVPVQTIAPLDALPLIQALDLSNTHVRDLSPLVQMSALRSLNLRFLPIVDISPLSALTELRSLDLSGTDVADLSPLRALAKMRTLALSVTRITDLWPLATLNQLVSLDVSNTHIADIAPVAAAQRLAALNLNGTSVSDLEPLARLTMLQQLDLGWTRIQSLQPLSGLAQLAWLNIEGTWVADVSPLAPLTKLHFLATGGSQVRDVSALKQLPHPAVRPDTASDDPVGFWNERSNRSIVAAGADAFLAARVHALESIAVLDTIRSLQGSPGFSVRLPAPGDIPLQVAIAGAAFRVLSHLFPDQGTELTAALDVSLREQPSGPLRRTALAFGAAIADALLYTREGEFQTRDGDGLDRARTLETEKRPGRWRPTPPGLLPPGHSDWKNLRPFGLVSPDQFRPPGPPALDSGRFRDALSAVRAAGALNSTTRTQEQTEIARHWSDQTGSHTPAGHWNAIALLAARAAKIGIEQKATMLAALNVAIVDGVIAMGDAKYTYWMARPITLIREGGPGWAADRDWTPLLETPNHPSYVSGHSVISGAAAAILTRWFGNRPFTFTSDTPGGGERSFQSFTEAGEEASASRTYGGIHFPFDEADGLILGRTVGAWTLQLFTGEIADHGPVLMLMDGTSAAHGDLVGCALDNVAPIDLVTARVDDGAAFRVAVDGRGLFTLPARARGHRIRLSAVSAGGLSESVTLQVPSL